MINYGPNNKFPEEIIKIIKIMNTIDRLETQWIEFYIKRVYSTSMQDYFEVNATAASKWRKDGFIPPKRELIFRTIEGINSNEELKNKTK